MCGVCAVCVRCVCGLCGGVRVCGAWWNRCVCVASDLEEQGWVELDHLGEQIEEDLQLRLGRRRLAEQMAEHKGQEARVVGH